jgi:hypothetical protein
LKFKNIQRFLKNEASGRVGLFVEIKHPEDIETVEIWRKWYSNR